MKKMLFPVFVLLGLVFFSGCAFLQPKEMSQTQDMIEKAKQGEAEQNCPEAFLEAVALYEEAKNICPCKAQLAKEKAAQAKARLEALCPDSDGDGVADELDQCPNTPPGMAVNTQGCSLDSDGDGIYDNKDQCPGTPSGVQVDSTGCPVVNDSDGDGVTDDFDRCPGTPQGAQVGTTGCWELGIVYFDTDQSRIKPEFYELLDNTARVMQQNPGVTLSIHGHTDTIATDGYNQVLSEKRAAAVKQYLMDKGVPAERLEAKSFGEKSPRTSNLGAETRAYNRRVELHPAW